MPPAPRVSSCIRAYSSPPQPRTHAAEKRRIAGPSRADPTWGDGDFYADYGHGIRLVKDRMIAQGVEMSTAAVLAHPTLHVLLSDEGVVTNPRY